MEKQKILIIDDDPGIIKTLSEILRVKGYELFTAKNGTEGLDILKQFFVNLAIIDLGLPDMSGLEVLGRAKATSPFIEVIILTGNTSLNSAIEAMNRGAFSYLLKPYDIDQLMLNIRRALERQRDQEEIAAQNIELKRINDRLREVNTILENDAEELKQAVKALRKSEERFKQIAESVGEWIWEVDADGLYTYTNPKVKEILGYKPDEIVGRMHFYDFFVPEKRGELKKTALETFAKKVVFRGFVNQCLHKNGNRVILETSGVPSLDEQGRLICYRGADIDITERKLAEQALLESESKFRTLFETANDAIFLVDQYIFIDCNLKTLEIFGCTREQIIGQPPYLFSPEVQPDGRNSMEKAQEKMDAAFRGQKQFFEWKHSRYDGTPFDAVVCLNIFSTGGKNYLQAIVRDITERKRAEEKLRESEKRFATIFFSNPAAIAITRTDNSEFTDVNLAWQDVTGYTHVEAVGYTPFELNLWVNLEQRELLMEMLQEHGKAQGEIQIRKKSGEIRDMLISAELSQLTGETYLLTMAQDITERKRAEEVLALSVTRTQAFLDIHRMANEPQQAILDFALEAAQKVCRSQFSFIGLINETESFMSIHAWSKNTMAQCSSVDKPIHFPIAEAGVWGDCVRQRKPVTINDYEAPCHGRKGYPEGHVPIRRFLGVPVFDGNKIVAVAGVANKKEPYTEDDVSALISLVNKMWEILRRKWAEEALYEANAYNRSLIEASLDPLVTIGTDGRITDVNIATEVVTGYNRTELIGTEFSEYFTEPEQARAGYQEVFRIGSVHDHPLELRHRDGHVTSVLYNAALYRDKKGQPVGVFAAARDITARKQAENELHTSLHEKELLLMEVHHRVKNNMQMVSGILDLQVSSTGNPELIERLNESQRRIRSMALIHEKLYDSKDFSRIDLVAYVRTLSRELFRAYESNPGKINLVIQSNGEINLDVNKAIPCGLILNELISNVLKHAFPGDETGMLEIIISETKNTEIEIVVRDNGLGIPGDVDIHQPRSVGLHLVNGLVMHQLDGQIEVRRDIGTEFRITFPLALFV